MDCRLGDAFDVVSEKLSEMSSLRTLNQHKRMHAVLLMTRVFTYGCTADICKTYSCAACGQQNHLKEFQINSVFCLKIAIVSF